MKKQKIAASNEILRTEVLSRLGKQESLVVVTYPDALAEKVVCASISATVR